MNDMEENKEKRISKVLAPLVLATGAYLHHRSDEKKKKLQESWGPDIALPGEKVIAIEDVSSDGIGDSIKKGTICTVRWYREGEYSFEGHGAVYNPYLGEYCGQSFLAKHFRKLACETDKRHLHF